MTVIKMRGLNAAEYDEIKKAAKELSFKVSIRQWKRNYAYGAIDIRAMKADGYSFTREQLDELYALMKRFGLCTQSENYFETVPHYDVIYMRGVCFLYKQVA